MQRLYHDIAQFLREDHSPRATAAASLQAVCQAKGLLCQKVAYWDHDADMFVIAPVAKASAIQRVIGSKDFKAWLRGGPAHDDDASFDDVAWELIHKAGGAMIETWNDASYEHAAAEHADEFKRVGVKVSRTGSGVEFR